jgi:hypothetical protein
VVLKAASPRAVALTNFSRGAPWWGVPIVMTSVRRSTQRRLRTPNGAIGCVDDEAAHRMAHQGDRVDRKRPLRDRGRPSDRREGRRCRRQRRPVLYRTRTGVSSGCSARSRASPGADPAPSSNSRSCPDRGRATPVVRWSASPDPLEPSSMFPAVAGGGPDRPRRTRWSNSAPHRGWRPRRTSIGRDRPPPPPSQTAPIRIRSE